MLDRYASTASVDGWRWPDHGPSLDGSPVIVEFRPGRCGLFRSRRYRRGIPVRVLFTTAPLRGHFFPLVSLARAFVAAGHEVVVSAPLSFHHVIEEAELPAALLDTSVRIEEYADGTLAAETAAGGTCEASGRRWARLAIRSLDGMRQVVGTFRPDLVVSEPGEYAGRLVATLVGLPWVLHHWGFAELPGFYTGAVPEFDKAGLPRPESAVDSVHPCPPRMLPPGMTAGHTMRYIPYNGVGALPDWARRPDNSPTVFLSFGSILPLYGGQEVQRLTNGIATHLDRNGVSVVIGMAESSIAGLGRLPRNVIHCGWAPLDRVLGFCTVAAHHGGTGTAMTAAVYGVPQLVMPHLPDQEDAADRLVAAGSAVRMSPDPDNCESVATAILALGEDPYPARAAVLARDIADQREPWEIAEMLTKYAT